MSLEIAYTYKATVHSIVDADTLKLNIDLGFGVTLTKQKVRLYNIDAWEITGKEKVKGLLAKDYLEAELPEGSEIRIKSYKTNDETLDFKKGMYGRWLVDLYKEDVNLNHELVSLGHAKLYNK